MLKKLILIEIVVVILIIIYSYTVKNYLLDNNQINQQSSIIISSTPADHVVYPTLEANQIIITQILKPNTNTDEWGIAKKIDEHTYSIKVGSDPRMATRQEILTALNNYRVIYGQWALQSNDILNNYSQQRADFFQSIQTTDKHQGFNDYLENNNGFIKLGFSRLGENSYFGGPLYGVHLIEWVFAKSPGHDANQLYGEWTDVGIGVTTNAVNIIFGKEKL